MAENTYPHFEITSKGLAELHREAGRLLHEAIERRVANEAAAATIAEARALLERQRAPAEAAATDEPAPMVDLEQKRVRKGG